MAAGMKPAGPRKLDVPPSHPGRKTVAQRLTDDDPTTAYAILMPRGFVLKEGTQLWEGVRLGKFLGAGAQAKVFRLTRDDGAAIGKVIKVNHGGAAGRLFNNDMVWVSMEREWALSQQLRAALQEPDGRLPGFMKVADCLVSSGGSGSGGSTSGSSGGTGAFAGMLAEELHGWEVYKRIDTPEFHNIHYVREMLFQVFSALDRAQRKLGFHHADLGMRNVMEHYPSLWEELPAEEAQQGQAALLRQAGHDVNADGSRLPLGPEVEFKIIDFGIAKFSAKLAAAAAGRQAQEVVEALHESLGRERIIFGSEDGPASIEFEPPGGAQQDNTLRARLKLPCKARNICIRRCLAHKASRAVAATADSPAVAAAAAGPGSSADASVAAAAGAELEAGKASPLASSSTDGASRRGSFELSMPARLASPGLPLFHQAVTAVSMLRRSVTGHRDSKPRRKKRSPIETIYRHFWHRKGDAFHLLLGLALALDDRLWPEEDEDLVQALCSLVHHVTGIKMRARTWPSDLPQGRCASGSAAGPAFGRRSMLHWFRRWQIRLKGHLLPYNSGLLAREALSHPFFGAGAVKHARAPVPLREAFPAAAAGPGGKPTGSSEDGSSSSTASSSSR